MTGLQLRAERSGQRVERFIDPAPALPFVQRYAARQAQIGIKSCALLCSERRIQHVEIGFVVDAERTAVEVGRADRGPQAIDNHHFAVVHGRLVLVNFNASAQQHIHAMVERAVAAGAVLETGGVLPEGPGHFYPPTLLSGCRQDMEIIQEEIFGPVLPVLQYRDIDEALAMANDHQFGLSSVLYTENYRTAMKVANAIEAGELYVNRTPADPYQGFHAGWKRSGLGGDDGKHGMLEFTQTRLVVMKY